MAVDYDTLVAAKTTSGSIKEWCNSDDLPVTTILTMAEAEIYKHLLVQEMLTEATGSVSTSNDYISLPTRYRNFGAFWFTGNDKAVVRHSNWEQVVAARLWDGASRLAEKPLRCFATDSLLYFDQLPDQAYAYSFWHYAALAPLSGSNTTNFLTDKYPEMLLSCCLWKAFNWRRFRAEADEWKKQTMEQIADAKMIADREAARNAQADPFVVTGGGTVG